MNDKKFNKPRTQMMDKLSKVKPYIATVKPGQSASAWMKDGLDHINISKAAQTHAGRILNLDHIRAFEHPVLGPFRSLNSLWFLLRAKYKTDSIRNMTGSELRNFVSNRCGGFGPRIDNFRAVIMHSAYLRLKSSKEMATEVAKSTLPFDCYRTLDSGIRVRFDYSDWFIAGYEEVRKALKEDREPKFDFLIDAPSKELYAGAVDALIPKHEEGAIEAAEAKVREEAKLLKKQQTDRKPQKLSEPSVLDTSMIQDIDAGHSLLTSPSEEVEESIPPSEVVEEDIAQLTAEDAAIFEEIDALEDEPLCNEVPLRYLVSEEVVEA